MQIGSRVDVSQRMKLKNGEESPMLISKLLDIMDEKTIMIAVPMNKMVNVPLHLNEEVDLFFYTNTVMLSASAKVKERLREGSIPVIKMILTGPLQKIQRRQFFRIECHIPFRFAVLEEKQNQALQEFHGTDKLSMMKFHELIEGLEEEVKDWASGVIVDLSGGGVRFITEKDLAKGDTIIISMSLQNGEVSDDLAMVSRLISVEEKREIKGKKEIRASFYKIKDALRESIVKFVFDEERRIRRKSL